MGERQWRQVPKRRRINTRVEAVLNCARLHSMDGAADQRRKSDPNEPALDPYLADGLWWFNWKDHAEGPYPSEVDASAGVEKFIDWLESE